VGCFRVDRVRVMPAWQWVGLTIVVALGVVAALPETDATHLRGGIVSWESSGTGMVEFRGELAGNLFVAGNPSLASPPFAWAMLDFGDGSPPVPVYGIVIDVNSAPS
jgi:hypothetical protein